MDIYTDQYIKVTEEGEGGILRVTVADETRKLTKAQSDRLREAIRVADETRKSMVTLAVNQLPIWD